MKQSKRKLQKKKPLERHDNSLTRYCHVVHIMIITCMYVISDLNITYQFLPTRLFKSIDVSLLVNNVLNVELSRLFHELTCEISAARRLELYACHADFDSGQCFLSQVWH